MQNKSDGELMQNKSDMEISLNIKEFATKCKSKKEKQKLRESPHNAHILQHQKLKSQRIHFPWPKNRKESMLLHTRRVNKKAGV